MTRGLAINNRGVIGGRFVDNNNVSRSFLLDHGAFTIFDFPGATATILQDLNDSGQIVGAYTETSGIFHGFLLSRGNFTTHRLSRCRGHGGRRDQRSGTNRWQLRRCLGDYPRLSAERGQLLHH